MLLRLWILLCAVLVAAGWLLSLLRDLTIFGYLGIVLVFAGCVYTQADSLGAREPWYIKRKLRRFISWKRLLPLFFVVMTVVLLCRGLMIPPFHGDALSYRIPRMLNWMLERRWYWIDAQDPRLNTRGFVSEFLTMPLLLSSFWDNLVFLPNWICFLFFPQVIFQVWREWGVSSRMAWLWMWLLPAGFCYSLQACNASTDIIGTFFALAAFAFLRRRPTIPPVDILCSFLSIALATGVKLTMAPLIVPWLIVVFAKRALCFRWRSLTITACVWAAVISFIPNVVANLIYVGDVSGLSLEPKVFRAVPHLDRLIGNIYVLGLDNLAIPAMGDNVVVRVCLECIPPGPMILSQFEPDTLHLYHYFSVEQEGLGVFVTIAAMLIFLFAGERKEAWAWRDYALLYAATWALFFFGLWENTAVQVARLISAYYPFLLATLFATRRWPVRWRRSTVSMVAAIALGGSIVCFVWSTDHPLIGKDQNDRLGLESKQMAVLHRLVPDSEQNIGMIRFWNEWESWAWQPYGTRRVYELPGNPAPADLARRNISYVIVTHAYLKDKAETIRTWAGINHAKIIGGLGLPGLTGIYWDYYIVKFDGAAATTPSPQPSKPTPP